MHFILKCLLPVNWVKGRQCFQSSASVSLSFQRGWDPMCYVTITHDALNLTVQEHHPHPSLPSLKQRDTGPPVVTSDGHTGDLFKPVHFSTPPPTLPRADVWWWPPKNVPLARSNEVVGRNPGSAPAMKQTSGKLRISGPPPPSSAVWEILYPSLL